MKFNDINWSEVPSVITKEQMRLICHCSKRTALYYLKSGKIPCEYTGKKTRCYKIKREDLMLFLEDKEQVTSSESKSAEQKEKPVQSKERKAEQKTEKTKTEVKQETTTKQTAQKKPKEEPVQKPKPNETTKPAKETFDVNEYVAYAKNYAQSIGLSLDSTATECWDNPITANPRRKNIKGDIQSRLNRYKNVEGFTAVWVWAEKVTDTEYEIYIGYC